MPILKDVGKIGYVVTVYVCKIGFVSEVIYMLEFITYLCTLL